MLSLRRAVAAAAAALFVCGAATAANAPHARLSARACGSITARLGGNDFSYRIRVVSESVSCVAARRVMRTFITQATRPRAWFCARGHGSDRSAASCARLSPAALVRAYLIAG